MRRAVRRLAQEGENEDPPRRQPPSQAGAAEPARRGGSSVEYMLILAGVVIPLGLMTPVMIHMIGAYWARIALVIRSPFG